MDGYPPGAPLVPLEIDELATVKSALPSVVMHSGALEPHSLFCTMYVPPETDAVCDWQRVDVAACAPAVPMNVPTRPPSASKSAAAVTGTGLERVMATSPSASGERVTCRKSPAWPA